MLGIVRGGVYAGLDVARSLDLPLDLVMRRPLQDGSGNLLCAVRVAGTLVLDERCASPPAGSPERAFVDDALPALAAREAVCRGTRAPARIAERTVLLVDNGMRTGQTMAVAIGAVRTMNAGRMIAAAPVGPLRLCALVGRGRSALRRDARRPRQRRNGVARFDVPEDSQIRSLLERQ